MKKQLTNQSIRKRNKINMLLSLIEVRESTRSELAERNGISVMTVKKIVGELMEAGIVQEKEVLDTSLGRKPRAVEIHSRFGATVCVSLTSKLFFRYVLYDLYGELLEECRYKIEPQHSYRDNLYGLIAKMKSGVEKSGLELLGIGISVPGAYYSDEDVVNYDLIPPLCNLHLHSIFTEAFGLDNILITHDVFIAAQAEYDLMKKAGSLFYFYVGDGVGGAFIDRGKWHTGATLVAGEVGQCILRTEQGEQTLEACTSIPVLEARLRPLFPKASFAQLLQMYDEKVPEVVAVIDEAAGWIARSLYNVAWVLNPHCIVIGSSFRRYAEIIAEACRVYNERLETLPIRMEVAVVPSQLPQYGELLGCFRLLKRNWVEDICDTARGVISIE